MATKHVVIPATLEQSAVAEAYFKGPTAVREAWSSFGTSGKPMCEPTDGSNSDIVYEATPSNVGNLGVCSD